MYDENMRLGSINSETIFDQSILFFKKCNLSRVIWLSTNLEKSGWAVFFIALIICNTEGKLDTFLFPV